MDIMEKRKALEAYCESRKDCGECKCDFDAIEGCFSGSDEHMLENFERVFGSGNLFSDNPYWKRICKLSDKQRKKGVETYGQGLEDNPAAMLKRIEHLQEELVDALMYCEWIKDKLGLDGD